MNSKLKAAVKKYLKELDKEIEVRDYYHGAKLQAKLKELEHIILSIVVEEYDKSEGYL
jgi:hypothetical protein